MFECIRVWNNCVCFQPEARRWTSRRLIFLIIICHSYMNKQVCLFCTQTRERSDRCTHTFVSSQFCRSWRLHRHSCLCECAFVWLGDVCFLARTQWNRSSNERPILNRVFNTQMPNGKDMIIACGHFFCVLRAPRIACVDRYSRLNIAGETKFVPACRSFLSKRHVCIVREGVHFV